MSLSNWHTVALGEICDVYDGPHATPKKVEHGPVFLGISCLSNGRLDLSEAEHLSEEDYITWTRRIAPKTGDVVFSYETRIGEVAQIPDGLKCCLGRRMGLLRPNLSKVDPRFLLYAYLGPNFQNTLRARTVHGSTVNRIPIKELPSYPIEIPPLPIQKRIAEILGRLDDKIEVNRRINRTLEAMAQTLYKHWFVDFGPFQDGPFVDSELGPIPEGWRIGRLDDIASVEMGASPDGSSYNSNGIGTPLINGPVEFGEYFAVKSKWTTQPTKLCQIGDLILCVRGSTTGRRVYADDVYCIGRGVCAIRAKNSWQTFVNLTVDYRLADLLLHTTGSVFPSLSSSDIRGFKVALPSGSVINAFCAKVGKFEAMVHKNIGTSKQLAVLRDYLLPKLLSGEVPVDIAEKQY